MTNSQNAVTRPLCIDLFCGEGGAGVGYHAAGFDVVGIDLAARPRYPYRFSQLDALDALERLIACRGRWLRRPVALVHASPPCQRFSALNNGTWGNASGHPDLIGPTRELLDVLGLPYVIENVPGSPLREPVMLCGGMFGLAIEEGALRRHRLFETNWPLAQPDHPRHTGPTMGVYGHGRGGGPMRGRSCDADQARRIMGMPWASRDGCSQAIPPAYTEHIGRELLAQLRADVEGEC